MIYVRSALAYDGDQASLINGVDFTETVSLTQQQFAEDADINTIVRRFGLIGTLPESWSSPQSGDFSGISDFHEALNLVTSAQQSFMEVPAELRARFNNDPGRLLNFLDDDSNKEEAIKLGLVNKPVEVPRPPPMDVRVVADPV